MRKATPYWILFNWKKRSVWHKQFKSFEEAKKELAVLNAYSQDWKIEQHESFHEVETGDNGEEFSKF